MASDLAISGHVSRDELGQPALAIDDRVAYEIVAWGPGAASWRRNTVRSPFVAGEFLVSAVKDAGTAQLAVRVKGETGPQMQGRLATLCRAFEQFSYDLEVTMEGTVFQYRCQMADYEVGDGGQWGKHELMAHQQVVSFVIPRNPIPIYGGI